VGIQSAGFVLTHQYFKVVIITSVFYFVKKYSHSLTNRKGATSHFVAAGKAGNALCLHIR
jgi:hypothetical protein